MSPIGTSDVQILHSMAFTGPMLSWLMGVAKMSPDPLRRRGDLERRIAVVPSHNSSPLTFKERCVHNVADYRLGDHSEARYHSTLR